MVYDKVYAMKSHDITENPPSSFDDIEHVLKSVGADDVEPNLVVPPPLPWEIEQSLEVSASSRKQFPFALEGPPAVPDDDSDLGGQQQPLLRGCACFRQQEDYFHLVEFLR